MVESCVGTLEALLNVVQNLADRMWEEALRVAGHLEHMTIEQRAAAAEVCSSCTAVLGDLTEPLLCQLGPAVLREVRKVEKLPSSTQTSSSSSRGSSNSSSNSGSQQADASMLTESVMTSFGRMVLQKLLRGKKGAECHSRRP
jgi:hypothetical protein